MKSWLTSFLSANSGSTVAITAAMQWAAVGACAITFGLCDVLLFRHLLQNGVLTLKERDPVKVHAVDRAPSPHAPHSPHSHGEF